MFLIHSRVVPEITKRATAIPAFLVCLRWDQNKSDNHKSQKATTRGQQFTFIPKYFIWLVNFTIFNYIFGIDQKIGAVAKVRRQIRRTDRHTDLKYYVSDHSTRWHKHSELETTLADSIEFFSSSLTDCHFNVCHWQVHPTTIWQPQIIYQSILTIHTFWKNAIVTV